MGGMLLHQRAAIAVELLHRLEEHLGRSDRRPGTGERGLGQPHQPVVEPVVDDLRDDAVAAHGCAGRRQMGRRPALDRRGREIGPGGHGGAAHQRRHQVGPQHDDGVDEQRADGGERGGAGT
jgi:hypothetical protein